jgi:hypothetical protein
VVISEVVHGQLDLEDFVTLLLCVEAGLLVVEKDVCLVADLPLSEVDTLVLSEKLELE